MAVLDLISKAFFYQDLGRGTLCPSLFQGMIRQKYPVADRVHECKEKFKIIFCCFSVIKNIVAPLYFSHFYVKLIFI